jgi:Uma2 family endonuclease
MALAQTQPAPLTYAQLVRLREKLDERYRYELIAGDLQVSPAPGVDHQWVLAQLFGILWTYVVGRTLGMVFVAPLDVIFSEHDVVEPDILYLTVEQVERTRVRGIEEPPTLVVEIQSPSTQKRDRTLKLELYERQGVSHYWLVHPSRRSLQAYELRGRRYELLATLTGNAEFRPALFPGLTIRLGDVWPPRSLARGR